MSEFTKNKTTEVPAKPRGSWLGGWVLVPAVPIESTVAHPCTYLERDGERVPLLHCSVELKEFAELMSRIEAKFTSHYAEQEERE
jgi:hypothetical protein